MQTALTIHVDGIVQGVGFRPFVYRCAKRHLVNGWVLNAADGVTIHAEGDEALVDQFVLALSEEAPSAAQVKSIELEEVPLQGFDSFEIRFSDESAVTETTLVSPDLATCDDCLAELFNPKNRRYRYPFINCTNCGPRFTIIESLPYDRPRTSMKGFAMCDACRHEYEHPENRRFHAQPDACFDCGPHISWYEAAGEDTRRQASPIVSVNQGVAWGSMGDADGVRAPLCHPERSAKRGVEGSPAPQPEEGIHPQTEPTGSVKQRVVWGDTREESDLILARAVELLHTGKILAVKGLGGFHLVCDACNSATLAELRRRKRREGKAFAVMVADVAAAREWAQVSAEEERLLESPARPIVLLRKRADVAYPAGLADALPELGIMLPTTPLQHLLVRDFGGMLVMTSGNLHDEPIQTDDAEAYTALAGVADAFLGNDRPILSRYDDSVARVLDLGDGETAIQMIRRARGYAPLYVPLFSTSSGPADAAASRRTRFADAGPDSRTEARYARPIDAESGISRTLADVGAEESPSGVEANAREPQGTCVFAAGPEQKNTFTLVRGGRAFVSQHVGDMENAETYDSWLEAKRTYERLFEATPTLVACDLHPEYLSSKWASNQELPVERVQHHHAHIAAVMGENNLDGAVCGIAFDGTGYGADGAIWGGEVLLANRTTYERFANFAYVPMPGGAAAIKHPLRMAYGVLWAFDLLDHPAAADAITALGEAAPVCEQMVERGLNTPMTSSVGRLFDAASALLGVCVEPTYEGEGAILLEAIMGMSGSGVLSGPGGKTGALTEEVGEGGSMLKRFPPSYGAAEMPAAAASPGTRPTAAESGPRTEVRYARSIDAQPGTAETLADFGSEPDRCFVEANEAPYHLDITKNIATHESTALDTSVVLFDAEPVFRGLLDDKAAGVPVPVIARRFHDAFVEGVLQASLLVNRMYGIGTVTLSGGVFMNRYLVENAIRKLAEAGFTVAINRDLPPNDASVSFGQAVVALARNTQTE